MGLDTGEWRQVRVTSVATFGGVQVGLALAFTGTVISPLKMSSIQSAIIGAAMPLAAILAGPMAGLSSDKLGRCVTMAIASIFFITGYCVMYFLEASYHTVLGRFFTGIGVGFTTVVGPLYVGEVASVKVRSFMGAMFQTQIMVGVFLSFLIGKFAKWNATLALASGAFSVLWMFVLYFSCESPAYLVATNREEHARKNLVWLRDSTAIETEMSKLKEECDKRRDREENCTSILKPENRHGFHISILCMAMQQLCGINAIMFYTTLIFETAGSKIEASDGSIVISAVQVAAMLAVIEAVRWFGRRRMLIGSSIAIGIGMLCVGAYYFAKAQGADVSGVSWIPLAAMIIVVIGFCFGLGPIPFMIMAEVLADEIKGVGGGLSVAMLWFCAFLVTATFAPLTELITIAGVFWMYAAFCFIGALAMHLIVIETHDKTLEAIQLELKPDLRETSQGPIGTALFPTRTRVFVFPSRPASQADKPDSQRGSSLEIESVRPKSHASHASRESSGANFGYVE